MVRKGETATVSFFYSNLDGSPVSGATLQAYVRQDSGAWVPASGIPTERAPTLTPGFYDLQLTATETNCDHLAWYARSSTGVYAGSGQLETSSSDSELFDLIFATPETTEQQQVQCAFMDRLADHVLRRAQASAEQSTHGDAIGTGSLLGVIALLTQGQMVVTNCAGDKYIMVNSAQQGQPPLGALRVVSNADGVPIGVLPLTGPNAIPDITQNCECP